MNWDYVAGFFDGEGSVTVCAHASGRKATANFAQSGSQGLQLLMEIKGFLNAQNINCSVFCTGKAGRYRNRLPSYRLTVGGFGSLTKFLTAIFPYLRIKKVVSQDVLRYNKMFPNISMSPLAGVWRSEKQSKNTTKGQPWLVARRNGSRIGRPKGSLDKAPRLRRRVTLNP